MPFCPKCKYEYVQGIDVCPDCDLKLVEKLHEKPHEDHIDTELVLVARFATAAEAEMARLKLEGSGIEAVIMGGIARAYVAATMMDPDVQLMVRTEDALAARKVLGAG